MNNKLKNITIISYIIFFTIFHYGCGGSDVTYSKSSPFVGVWKFTFYSPGIDEKVDIRIQQDGTFSSEVHIAPSDYKLYGGIFDDGKIEGTLDSKGITISMGSLKGVLYLSNHGSGNFSIGSFEGPRGNWKAFKK